MRVEKDVYEDDTTFDRQLPLIIKYIKLDRCLSAHNGNDSFPQIFVASGLFSTNSTINAKETPSSLYRKERVFKALKAAGFHDIMTRSSDYSSQKNRFYAEQQAYIDLLILKKASCFIPALHASSMSYVVQRFRSFDNGDFGGDLLKEPCSPHLKEFQDWGF